MYTNQNIKRIGFACKWAEINKKGEISSVEGLNTGGTTHAWAKRQIREKAEEKVLDVARRNIVNTHNLIKKVATLDHRMRMVRLTSDMCSFYTMDDWKPFWQSSTVRNLLEHWFAPLGETARNNDVRVSFHPDQFVVLASDRPEVVNKSIEEFEYHVDMARWMGYGKKFQDIKINVHISGRAGVEGFRQAYKRLSDEARSSITIENEEISYGLNDCLQLSDIIPIVLDIHHHFIYSGEYIKRTDPRIEAIIRSWRGVRPVIHYSVSREDILVGHDPDILPNLDTLLETGFKKQKLRAHSDYMWSKAVNDWANTHWAWADCMVEAKAKNLASFKLFEYWKSLEV